MLFGRKSCTDTPLQIPSLKGSGKGGGPNALPPLPACGERSTCERSCAKQVGRAIATAIARGGGVAAHSEQAESPPHPDSIAPLALRSESDLSPQAGRGEARGSSGA